MKHAIRYTAKGLLVMLLSVMLVVSGCWTAQQWFDLVSALLPILGQTYLQFYGFAQGGAPDPSDVAKVQTLTKAGQDAIAQVEALIAAAKAGGPSTAAQINAVLAQLQQSVGAFLTDAQIKNSTRFAQFDNFATAILADVQDIIALLPVVVPSASGRGVTVTVNPSYSKAKSLPNVFKERLSRLPKAA